METIILAGLAALLVLSISNHFKLKKVMATLQEFEEVLARIDDATTEIANDLRDLREQLTNAGLPAEVEANVLARLQSHADRLGQMGSDVTNPDPGADTGNTGGGAQA